MTLTSRRTFIALTLGAVLLVGAAGCGSSDGGAAPSASISGGVSVDSATIDWPANPSVAALRMVVRNGGAAGDRLLAVSSPVATDAAVHRTETDDAGRSIMTPTTDLAIPPRSSVTFEPGGLHVMLTGITEDLQVGDDVAVTLSFDKAGDVMVTAKVVEAGTAMKDQGDHDH